MNKKCWVSLGPNGFKNIKAIFIQSVPKLSRSELDERSMDYATKREYTVDALVELVTFDKGEIYQIPFDQVQFVDEWTE